MKQLQVSIKHKCKSKCESLFPRCLFTGVPLGVECPTENCLELKIIGDYPNYKLVHIEQPYLLSMTIATQLLKILLPSNQSCRHCHIFQTMVNKQHIPNISLKSLC